MAVIKPKRHESNLQYVLSAFCVHGSCCVYSEYLRDAFHLTVGDALTWQSSELLRCVTEVNNLTSSDATTLTRRLAYIHVAQSRLRLVTQTMDICYRYAREFANVVLDAEIGIGIDRAKIVKKTESTFQSLAPYISDITLSLKRLAQGTSDKLRNQGQINIVDVLKNEFMPVIFTCEREEMEQAQYLNKSDVDLLFRENESHTATPVSHDIPIADHPSQGNVQLVDGQTNIGGVMGVSSSQDVHPSTPPQQTAV